VNVRIATMNIGYVKFTQTWCGAVPVLAKMLVIVVVQECRVGFVIRVIMIIRHETRRL